MTVTTGLSGNEIYCLNLKKLSPGNIVVGNSVHALGVVGSIGSGFKAMIGGEIEQVTQLIEEGRESAFRRMTSEAKAHDAVGITGVDSELIFHGSNIEFLSLGSVVHAEDKTMKAFSTSADGQELYAQLDAGYHPICFAFGNVAYSIGLGRGLIGGLKTFVRGEIKEYSDIFNHTRHLALERIIENARKHNANAVLGIRTTVLPFAGLNEMLMLGTASRHEGLNSSDIVTSDMTNIEMWNMAKMGYAPMKLLLGTSVYSLGFVGGVTSFFKSFVRGEIEELTSLIYHARENAIDIINREAKDIGADDVVGVKTYVYQLGNGLIEFMAIGTAVKKVSGMQPISEQLPPQAVVQDRDTFYDSVAASAGGSRGSISMNSGDKPVNNRSFISYIVYAVLVIIYLIYSFSR